MSAVSIDVEYLMSQPVKTLLTLVENTRRHNQSAEKFRATIQARPELFADIEALDIDVRFDYQGGSIDLAFAGSGEKLGKVWGLLRRAGYSTSSRPKAGDPSFSAFWAAPGDLSKIWLQFSSTVCKRIQTGTKMKARYYLYQSNSPARIAEDLGISVATLHNYLHDKHKIGAERRASAGLGTGHDAR